MLHSDPRLAEQAWLAVVRAYQRCSLHYERLLKHFDLTGAQFDTLLAIRALAHEAQPKRVARRLLVTRGNVSGILERLQRRGLIETMPHARDGRARRLRLTPAGNRLLERAQPAARNFIAAQMAPFREAELHQTLESMTRMYAHLETLDTEELATRCSAEPRQSEKIAQTGANR